MNGLSMRTSYPKGLTRPEVVGLVWILLALLALVPVTWLLQGSFPVFTVLWLAVPLAVLLRSRDASSIGIVAVPVRTLLGVTALNLAGLLGAAALGDLGKHFPDSDPAYKGISSLLLLEKIAALLREKRFVIANIDATLTLEQPKIAPHRSNMVEKIARALGIEPDRVSVKATTTEGMGFEGRGVGVSCRAVAVIKMTSDQ